MVDIRPVLIINNVNFSDLLKEVGAYSVQYEKREGSNGGLMKDGSMTVDIVAWKAVIKVKTKGATASAFSALLNTLITDYVDVTFMDPKTNTLRTATFIPDKVEAPMAYFVDGDVRWYNSTTITLTER